jgi:hypothetical protein
MKTTLIGYARFTTATNDGAAWHRVSTMTVVRVAAPGVIQPSG